ncbi:hypothetical protein HNQ80_004816 [Anaerosolibacter carboniphilus]|uniref:Uncharacterized protein n=1 Tax=Anaerosolibacter carboniphilus TaxID=1417629 RepID=A0A841L6C7_9FIRM|nr:hypothetical protein [Anaerosolibacter carboniphilus]MBB6218642.1 hypothetical protein [Anaerosolibacter carboniphilus]
MSKAKTTKKEEGKKKLLCIPTPSVNKVKNFPIPQEEIEELKHLANKKLTFSFRFLELEHEAFNLGGTCVNWVNDLFLMMQELSGITRNQFVNELRDHYRSHTHDWSKVDYRYRLNEEFLEQVECRQARISSSKGGIHGFIVGNRFYVVWIDPHHNLYPDERYGGLKIFKAPETCCGHRDLELQILNRKNKELEELLEEYTRPAM